MGVNDRFRRGPESRCVRRRQSQAPWLVTRGNTERDKEEEERKEGRNRKKHLKRNSGLEHLGGG